MKLMSQLINELQRYLRTFGDMPVNLVINETTRPLEFSGVIGASDDSEPDVELNFCVLTDKEARDKIWEDLEDEET